MKKVILLLVAVFTAATSLYSQEDSKGKIHGYMFGDYYYNFARDANISKISNAALKGEKDFNAFQFRRIYLGYDYKINSKFSTRLRLEANNSETTSGDKVGLFVKDAYLKWNKIFGSTDLVIGFSPTPTWNISESYWGYRSLEKTIMDLRKVASSRDLGISLKGKLNSSGSIKYWLMAGNGEGNKIEDDKHKTIYGHLALEPVKNLTITLYGHYKSNEDIEGLSSNEMVSNNVIAAAFFAGFQEKGNFSLGLEGFYQTQQNELNIVSNLDDETSLGISIFGSKDLSDKFSLIGRYDYFDPISNSDFEGDVRNYFLAAINYKADSKVWVMPNLVMETYEDLPEGTKFDSSITGRITVYYKFN